MRKRIFWGILITGLLLSSVALAAFEVPPDAQNTKNPIAHDDNSIAKGKALYSKLCISCHGPNAKGSEAGPNLTMRLKGQSDGEIFWKITNGSKPPAMPKYKKIIPDDSDRWHLVNYLKTLVK